MAQQVAKDWEHAQKLHKSLNAVIKGPLPTFDEIDHLLLQLRLACQNVIFKDFNFAAHHEVEKTLWEAHTTINSRYRRLVDAYRKGDQKKHMIEKRKLEKRYADFIKTSQHFYKGYIQRLASHFKGMTGLERILNRLALDSTTVTDRIQPSAELGIMVERSCHTTLLRLGDLSRYRNALRTRDRSWEAALAYYMLANDLHPGNGWAHNQMAVIALQEGQHLDGVYHMYRALVIEEPHVVSQGNLELEFKKIVKSPHSGTKKDSLGTLISWFSLLHAKFYEGVPFPSQNELEKEILSRLATLLRVQNFDETLQKLIIVNIAAESFAADKCSFEGPGDKSKCLQTFLYTFAFNVRFMLVLLEVLGPELEEVQDGEDIPNGNTASQKPDERISVTSRRVLPALRQYSIWLIARARFLKAAEEPVSSYITNLWHTYAQVLSKLVQFFPAHQLHTSPYLLEEDESTVGFKPFRDPSIPMACSPYVDETGKPKPRITDEGVERNHPNTEMQARGRDILNIGVHLALDPEYPLTAGPVGDKHGFMVVDGKSLINQPQRTVDGHASKQQISLPIPSVSVRNSTTSKNAPIPSVHHSPRSNVSESNFSLDSEMERIVESIVNSKQRSTPGNETTYGMHSGTANEIFGNSLLNEPKFLHNTPPNLPALPDSLYGGVFAPQPSELQPSSPTRLSMPSKKPVSPYSTKSGRESCARELDRITGSVSWTSSSSRSTPSSQGLDRLLPDPDTQRMPPPPSIPNMSLPSFSASSNFSDSSGIFGGTPSQRVSIGGVNGNNTTYYPGGTDFDRYTMLQSSPWDRGQPVLAQNFSQTPPAGQGG